MRREDGGIPAAPVPVQSARVAVVVPCFKVGDALPGVVRAMPPCVERIYVVDDACPMGSGRRLRSDCDDPRVVVIEHRENRGVGGAVVSGYKQALADDFDVIVKVDGDGQMDPALIPRFIEPILSGEADYTKGNRFHDLQALEQMPRMRLFGNAVLSFMAKASSGYWDVFDPTNGYTAIHAEALARIPLDKLSARYFFETDMLFRLGTVGAVVEDVPMHARYGDEVSNLRISRILLPFLAGHARNFLKRLFYRYVLRDFSIASVELLAGVSLLLFGLGFGLVHWLEGLRTGVPNPVGTVVVTALTVLMGLQLVLAFLSWDMGAVPRRPLQRHRMRQMGRIGE